MKRRIFLRNSAIAGMGLGLTGMYACTTPKRENESETQFSPFFQMSLAQWSLHRMIQDQGFDPYLFPKKAKELGFEGVDYVSQLYFSKERSMGGPGFNTELDEMVRRLNEEAQKNEIQNLVMMMDLQADTGDLAWIDADKRARAIEAHLPWIDASATLGCHSMRINLSGEKEASAWKSASIEALGTLAEYASSKKMNIIVENHGGLSSNASLLMEVINEVGMENCGTLPDFGNFCITKSEDDVCIEDYDRYQGILEMMPTAMSVSAKSHDFDEAGNETRTDYPKMLQIVKEAGYKGFIGVEYEGDRLSEEEGIIATKNLLLNSAIELA